MTHQRLETPKGTTAVTHGTERGVDWLQCVPDPDPSEGLGELLVRIEAPECWLVRDSTTRTMFLCPYRDDMNILLLLGSIGRALPFDTLQFELISDRPPRAVPSGHFELPTGEQPLPTVADLPVAVHVLFEKLEIELVEQASD
jgi:hypothetical protein